jgi:hypothetical protein
MAKDYFDRVCEYPTTEIEEEECLVEDLWNSRFELTINHKRRRLYWFYEVFREVMEKLNQGHVYAAAEMRETGYWKYIAGYHPTWRQEPRTRKVNLQMRYKFRGSIDLFHDIKERGMIDPLDVIVENGEKRLYRGYRRLVILKTLGTEKARVRYAIVHNSVGP